MRIKGVIRLISNEERVILHKNTGLIAGRSRMPVFHRKKAGFVLAQSFLLHKTPVLEEFF